MSKFKINKQKIKSIALTAIDKSFEAAHVLNSYAGDAIVGIECFTKVMIDKSLDKDEVRLRRIKKTNDVKQDVSDAINYAKMKIDEDVIGKDSELTIMDASQPYV